MATLHIQKGNPSSVTITVTDANNVPLDLTGRTVFFTVKNRDDYSDDDALALITETITVHSDPTNGITTCPLSAVQTDIEAKIYKADVRVYGEGFQSNTVSFYVEVEEIVTKRIA